jgi:hypothetical protein
LDHAIDRRRSQISTQPLLQPDEVTERQLIEMLRAEDRNDMGL